MLRSQSGERFLLRAVLLCVGPGQPLKPAGGTRTQLPAASSQGC